MSILEKARLAKPIGKEATNDIWGTLMPVMRVLVEERGFTSLGAARWLEKEGEIKPGEASLVALSYRQRQMRERRRSSRLSAVPAHAEEEADAAS